MKAADMPMTMSSARALPETKSNRPQSSEDAVERTIYFTKAGADVQRNSNSSVMIRLQSRTIGASSETTSMDLSIDRSTERSTVLSIDSVTSEVVCPDRLG